MSTLTAAPLTIPDTFPPFSLTRLLKTVFNPKAGERVAILIDLEDPHQVKDFAFLKNPDLTIQRHAYEVFYEGLKNSVLKELRLTGGELFAYKITGGSNLDLPDLAVTTEGKEISLERDIYPNYDLTSLRLHLFCNRAADCIRQGVWLSWRDFARAQPNHFGVRPRRRLQRGERQCRKASVRND